MVVMIVPAAVLSQSSLKCKDLRSYIAPAVLGSIPPLACPLPAPSSPCSRLPLFLLPPLLSRCPSRRIFRSLVSPDPAHATRRIFLFLVSPEPPSPPFPISRWLFHVFSLSVVSCLLSVFRFRPFRPSVRLRRCVFPPCQCS